MFYSPLRYPGGKGKITPLMKLLIEKIGLTNGTYIEPFAGGAGIAIELLLTDVVSRIVINDKDKAIYSFWRSILSETDRFIEKIQTVDLSTAEWNIQKTILTETKSYSFDLGFAAFYLNRTNRSGIIKGGIIGGTGQNGKWKLDARFNRDDLSNRILNISKRKDDIIVYNKDVESLIKNYLDKYRENSFIYFDPPYFNRGKQLYMNYFTFVDHQRIHDLITENCNCNWVVTYDDAIEIRNIYRDCIPHTYDLNYSVAKKRKANELIFFGDPDLCPTKDELYNSGITINLR